MSNSGTTLGAIVTAFSIGIPVGLLLRRRPDEITRSSGQRLFDAAIETHHLSRHIARALVMGDYTPDQAHQDVIRIYAREIDLVSALERYAADK